MAIGLMGVGAVLLGGVLVSRGVGFTSMSVLTRFEAMTAYALALTGAYGVWSAYRYTRGMAGILLPYATLLLLCGISACRQEPGAPAPLQGVAMLLHVATAYAAFGVFTLASVSAVIYLMQDSNLKNKRFGVVWERLPSLEKMDHIMSRLVGVAFLLLTVSMGIGFVLVRKLGGGEEWLLDPKVLATAVLWILLAVFVHLRASSDRHGRGIAMVAVFGLASLLFAFMGVHLLAPSVHAFIQIGLGAGAP